MLLQAYSLISRPVCAWKAAGYRKGRTRAARAPFPVISVGNLALGGTGKTPVVGELIRHFLARGYRPALITRGYGGGWEKAGGVLSDSRTIFGGVRDAGDEPVLIARRFPAAGVFVGKDRIRSCWKAEALGFDLGLLDDGFQHLRLARDLDIVLHHPASPRPLRESENALSRADILLLPKGIASETGERFHRRFPQLSIFDFEVVAEGLGRDISGPLEPLSLFEGKRVLAVAGIAGPERFFTLLEKSGATLVERMTFPDHYPYPRSGIDRIAAAVARHKPDFVLTTEKDAVKWGPEARTIGDRPVFTLRIRIDLPSAFHERVEAALPPAKVGRG